MEELAVARGPAVAGEEIAVAGGPAVAGEELAVAGGLAVAGEELVVAGEELAEMVRSPFCRRMVRPLWAASMSRGTWASVAKAKSNPTAVSRLPSMTPIGGQKNPPPMRRILVMSVMRKVFMITGSFS